MLLFYLQPPDEHLADDSFDMLDDSQIDPDYVPSSDSSDCTDSFIAVGLLTFSRSDNSHIDKKSSSDVVPPISPVIPFIDDIEPPRASSQLERVPSPLIDDNTDCSLPRTSSLMELVPVQMSPVIPLTGPMADCPLPRTSSPSELLPAQMSPVIPLTGAMTDSPLPGTSEKTTKLDKKHFCLFCGKGVTKLKRHLLSFHQGEPEMFNFMAASGKSKEVELKKLRNAGDHLHNIDILKGGEGDIVVKKNIKRKTSNEDYVPCPRCVGYFFKRDLWRHKCPNLNPDDKTPKKQLVRKGRLILPMIGDDGVGELYESLRNGQIKVVIKHDETIKLVSQRELKRKGHDKDQHPHIRNKIRQLARLLVTLRERTGKLSAHLKDFIVPGHFRDVLEATKEVAEYSPQTNTYGKADLAQKIGHSLQTCCVLLKAKAIEDKDFQTKADCSAFSELISIKWNEEVSAQAARTLYQNKKNSPNATPLSEDVATLSKYLEDQAKSTMDAMSVCKQCEIKKYWTRLAEITLTVLILFNRRRQGEVSKMAVSDYTKSIGSQIHNKDVLEGLTAFEKSLCEKLKRIEITGKRGRLVPLILTDSMKASMDFLMENREKASISNDNPYFFARTNNQSISHIRGCDSLRKLTEEVPLQHPQLIRSTRLRKHIAMMTQLVNLKDNELDTVAQFMGHDIRIHREHYRLPSGTLQVAKVAKLLMSLNEGKMPKDDELNGDTIVLDEMEESSDDEETPSSETGKNFLILFKQMSISDTNNSINLLPY